MVERRPDPQNRRGVVIRFTPHGRAVLASAVEVMTEIEAEYAHVISDQDMTRLKRSLTRLLDRVDKSGEFGLD